MRTNVGSNDRSKTKSRAVGDITSPNEISYSHFFKTPRQENQSNLFCKITEKNPMW